MTAAAKFLGDARDVDVALRPQTDAILILTNLAHIYGRENLPRCQWDIYETVIVAVNGGGASTHCESLSKDRDLPRLIAVHGSKDLPHGLYPRPGVVVVDC